MYTSLSNLFDSTSDNQNVFITLVTGLSALYNFRSDENALITQQSTTFSTLIHSSDSLKSSEVTTPNPPGGEAVDGVSNETRHT
jgi:hypothetical protein